MWILIILVSVTLCVRKPSWSWGLLHGNGSSNISTGWSFPRVIIIQKRGEELIRLHMGHPSFLGVTSWGRNPHPREAIERGKGKGVTWQTKLKMLRSQLWDFKIWNKSCILAPWRDEKRISYSTVQKRTLYLSATFYSTHWNRFTHSLAQNSLGAYEL